MHISLLYKHFCAGTLSVGSLLRPIFLAIPYYFKDINININSKIVFQVRAPRQPLGVPNDIGGDGPGHNSQDVDEHELGSSDTQHRNGQTSSQVSRPTHQFANAHLNEAVSDTQQRQSRSLVIPCGNGSQLVPSPQLPISSWQADPGTREGASVSSHATAVTSAALLQSNSDPYGPAMRLTSSVSALHSGPTELHARIQQWSEQLIDELENELLSQQRAAEAAADVAADAAIAQLLKKQICAKCALHFVTCCGLF